MSGRTVAFLRFELLAAIVFAASCDSPSDTRTEPDGTVWQIQMGVVGEGGPSVAIPSRAIKGEPIEVKVMTYGSGCIAQGPTYSTVDGLSAVVEPYDSFVIRMPPRSACEDYLAYYPHTTMITFNQIGTATVVVRGRAKERGNIVSVRQTVTVE